MSDELEKLREENERMKTILRHAMSEKTGVYFICGESGDTGSDGLPDNIFVCPSFGVSGFVVYEKTERGTGYR